jgi:sugar phosphate permease
LGLDIKYLGVLDTINLGLMSAMLVVLPRIVFKNKNYSLVLYSLLPVLAFILFGLTNSLVYAIAFGVIFDLAWSARYHIVPTILNEYFSSKDRALSLSSWSFITGLGAAIFVPVALVIFKVSYLFAIIPGLLIISILLIYTKTKINDTNITVFNN